VQKGRNSSSIRNGILGEGNWTETNDAIDAAKASRPSGSANRLGCDSEAAKANRICELPARKGATTVTDGNRTTGRRASRGRLARARGTAPGV
jgi:hypothetical protein